MRCGITDGDSGTTDAGRPVVGNFQGWQHVRGRIQHIGLTRKQQIYIGHLLKEPEIQEMAVPIGRPWFGGYDGFACAQDDYVI